MYIAILGYKAQLRPSSYVIGVIFQLVIFRQTKQVTILHIYQVTHCSKADIHFCQKFDNFLFSCFEIVLIRRTHTAAQSNAQSLSKARTYGSEMGCTVGRTPGGLTVRRGRGVLGLGGLRACEGVWGRVRACEGVWGRVLPWPFCSSIFNLKMV